MKLSTIKNIASKGILSAALIASSFACKDELLDVRPRTAFPPEVVFDTPARVELQVNNLYAQMKSGQFLGGRYQIYGDIRADDFLNRTTNGVTGYLVWQHTLTETSQNDVINLWDAAYNAINQINVFLQGMEDNGAKFDAVPFPANYRTTTAVAFKAEARFLRALAYHSLLQLYARPYIDQNGARPGLPLRLRAETDLTGNDLARSTVAQVYDQIIADLDYAEQNLPLTISNAFTRTTRAHRNTAIALKTRVYLTMGDYPKVIEEADKIVTQSAPFTATTGVAHALQSTPAAVFAPPATTTENIFSFPFTAQNAPGTQNQLAFYYRSSSSNATLNPVPGGGEYSLNTSGSGILANTAAWPANDARRSAWVYTVGAESFLGKYPQGTPFLDNAPVIRYAEVLLNLAEAIARTTPDVDDRALDLLNAVRLRSHDTALAPGDNDELVSMIMTERRIEFLGEGIRNMDIMRLNDTFPAKGAVGALTPASNVYVWPIPSTELQTNALMTRN